MISKYITLILLVGSLTLVLARSQEQQCADSKCANFLPKVSEKTVGELVSLDERSHECDCAKPKKKCNSADEETLDDEESIEKPVESDESEVELDSPIQTPVDETLEQLDGEIDEEKAVEISIGNNENVRYEIVDGEDSKKDPEAKKIVETTQKQEVKVNKQQESINASSKIKKSSEKKNKRAKRDTKGKTSGGKKGSSKQVTGKKFSKKSGKNDSAKKNNQKKNSKKN